MDAHRRPGALLVTSAIILFVLTVDLPSRGVPVMSPLLLSTFTGSVLLLTAFTIYESRYASEPIYPPSLLMRRSVVTYYLALLFGIASQLLMMYTVPLYFQVTSLSSTTVAG